MKYGCIGEHLKHSFSKEIHNALADYEYEIREIPRDELDGFMKKRDFVAINVTIPYKELVLPYLSFIDGHAREIGAVNTIVNRGGQLYGYNTDFYGMTALIRHAGIDVEGKKVAVLGTGGTSKTAKAVAKSLLAREIVTVSRKKGEGRVTYEELYEKHADTEVIVNTTPVGMFPNIFGKATELCRFDRLAGVVDAVYNPLQTPLVLEGKKLGAAAQGGLYMLVAQAVRASEIFTDSAYCEGTLDRVFEKIKREKQNIVLIGMPASGKSTVGAILAKRLGRELVDTDALVVKAAGMTIPEIFERFGEEEFRRIEAEVVREVSLKTCSVIATGGGVPLRKENIEALSQNGRIYFIDRPLKDLLPTEDRPLASTKEAIVTRYEERYGVYTASADASVCANCDADGVADKIIGDFFK